MSEHTLPDDPADWPRDPTQLLGVSHNVDERGLKRAYTRLIRKFKPEHHPEEFAKIRAAYEELLRRAQFMQQFRDQYQADEAGSSENESDSPADTILEDVSPNSVDVTSPPTSNPAPDTDFALEAYSPWAKIKPDAQDQARTQQIEDAWTVALDGDWNASYHQFRKLLDDQPGNEEVCLRLFWLLRLKPDIDPRTEPAHWLVLALKHSRLYGRAWDLYRLELERLPSLGSSDECRSLLDISAPLERLTDLAEWRWKAVARSNLFSLIQSDLAALRERFLDEAPQSWARLLFKALDLGSWQVNSNTARELVAYCEKSLRELPELEFELSEAFEHWEILQELSSKSVADKWKSFPQPWASLIRDSWTEGVWVLRPRLLRILEQWIEQPRDMLNLLDELHRNHAIAVQQLAVVITRLGAGWHHTDGATRLDQLEIVLAEFLLRHDQSQYASFRLAVLDFCITWQIRIDDIITIFTRQNSLVMRSPDTISHLNNDLPLRTLLDGITAFWRVAWDD